MIGSFIADAVPGALYAGVERLLTWKLAYHGVDANSWVVVTAGAFYGSKYPEGAQVTLPAIAGHRDVDFTDCPGNIGYTVLDRLRVDVQRDVMNSVPYPLAGWTPPPSGPGLLT